MEAAANELLQLQVGLRTDPGRERPVDEDSLGEPSMQPAELLARKGLLYVVADGMGGHVAGRLASDTAVRATLEGYYRDPSPDIGESLVAAVGQANTAVYAQAQDPAYKGMGSTLVAAVLRGSELYVANVGDSRAYLIRGQSITQLTQDHSWVEEQRRAGVLTEEEARNHPYSHIITRSLGTLPQVQVDEFQGSLQPGDVVLLCSDGLWGAVSAEQMAQAATSRPAQQAADELVALANATDGSDNISAVVIQIGMAVVALPPARPSLGCSPVVLSALLIGVGIIGLTMLLCARGPGRGRWPFQVTPPKTAPAIPAWTLAPTTLPTSTLRPTPIPTPTPVLLPTATLPPDRTPTPALAATSTLIATRVPGATGEKPAVTLSRGDRVRISDACREGAVLRQEPDPAARWLESLWPGYELTVTGSSKTAEQCPNCPSLIYYWPVIADLFPSEEGWVDEECLELIGR